MELKTSNVAKRLGVSTKTVQRWVKKYNIPCHKNEAGHYVFDPETLTLLEQIKFEQGAALDEMETEEDEADTFPRLEALFSAHFQPHMDKFASRLERIERQLEHKADEVVSFQLLQHRQEIEELNARIRELEQRIDQLEQAQQQQQATEAAKQKQRRGVGRIISLFM